MRTEPIFPSPVLTPATEAQLRLMRNTIYPAQSPNQVQTDASWEHIKHRWQKDEAWLTEQYRIETNKPKNHERKIAPCKS